MAYAVNMIMSVFHSVNIFNSCGSYQCLNFNSHCEVICSLASETCSKLLQCLLWLGRLLIALCQKYSFFVNYMGVSSCI